MSQRTKRKPSSIDVAKLAGVSQSAVSRAFSGASVSKPTHAKIMKAADILGYRPNALSRVLREQSNLVGIVIGEITNPFYPEVLENLLQELEVRGYRVLLKHLDGAQNADSALEEVLAYRVHGVIVTSSLISPEMARKSSESCVPLVLFNRHIRDQRISSISCDNVDAGRMVANLMIDAGFGRLAFISGNSRATSNQDRQKGFRDRIAERGGGEVIALGNEHSYENGQQSARSLISDGGVPEAIFCASDVIAFGAMDALKSGGFKVPEDVSIVGFDDIPMAGWDCFQLTTVRQPRRRMVREAVEMLVGHIEGDTQHIVRLSPGELIMRDTFKH